MNNQAQRKQDLELWEVVKPADAGTVQRRTAKQGSHKRTAERNRAGAYKCTDAAKTKSKAAQTSALSVCRCYIAFGDVRGSFFRRTASLSGNADRNACR